MGQDLLGPGSHEVHRCKHSSLPDVFPAMPLPPKPGFPESDFAFLSRRNTGIQCNTLTAYISHAASDPCVEQVPN